MNALIPIADVEKMANAVAKSGLFGMKTPEQAFALMMIAQAEGSHPALACQTFDIILGKPALKSSAMLGRFQQAGGVIKWIKHTDQEVSAEFSHPQSPTPLLIEWTMERAKRAGLGAKDNWIKYPRQMLRARVISEGVRATFPSSSNGMYATEEVVDMDTVKDPIVIKSSNTVEGLKEVLNSKPKELVQDADINQDMPDTIDLSQKGLTPVNQDPSTLPDSLDDGTHKNVITDPQRKRLYAIAMGAGMTQEGFKEWLMFNFNYASSKDILKSDYEKICTAAGLKK
jgi:hypothetical protein